MKSKHPLSDEAQAYSLTDLFISYTATAELIPGALYKQKEGMGFFNDDPVLTYLRPIDMEAPADQEMVNALLKDCSVSKLDIVIMRLSHSGQMIWSPFDSSMLRTYTP
jgi:hypothetical protein